MIYYDFIYPELISLCDWSLDYEQGGFISLGTNLVVTKAQNTSTDKHKFVPSAKDYIKAAKFGRICAIFHTHCGGSELSPQDKIIGTAHDIDIILILPSKEIKVFRPAIERYNCANFVIDYMKSIGKNIQIPELNINNLDEIVRMNNLKRVTELKENRIILIETEKGHHLGICSSNPEYYYHYNKDGELYSLIPKKYIKGIYDFR